jgi:shikimate kinase
MSHLPRIALVGYRGTGKSAVGRILAGMLDWTFLDADAVLEARTGKTIAELFTAEGESGFRDRETLLLEELCRLGRHVIATGGGCVLRELNRRLLNENAYVAWLSASPEVVWERIRLDPETAWRRPNLTASGGLQEVVELLAIREPHYRAVATERFSTEGRSPEQVAGDILAAWRSFSCSL